MLVARESHVFAVIPTHTYRHIAYIKARDLVISTATC